MPHRSQPPSLRHSALSSTGASRHRRPPRGRHPAFPHLGTASTCRPPQGEPLSELGDLSETYKLHAQETRSTCLPSALQAGASGRQHSGAETCGSVMQIHGPASRSKPYVCGPASVIHSPVVSASAAADAHCLLTSLRWLCRPAPYQYPPASGALPPFAGAGPPGHVPPQMAPYGQPPYGYVPVAGPWGAPPYQPMPGAYPPPGELHAADIVYMLLIAQLTAMSAA